MSEVAKKPETRLLTWLKEQWDQNLSMDVQEKPPFEIKARRWNDAEILFTDVATGDQIFYHKGLMCFRRVGGSY